MHLTGEVTRYKKKVVEKELETAKLRKESYELRFGQTMLSDMEVTGKVKVVSKRRIII